LIDETVPYERICINFRPEILEPLDPEGVLLSLYDGRPLGTHNRYTVDHGEELLALLPETGKDAPSGIFELAARSSIAIFGAPVWGFDIIRFANPAAWVAACILLVPAYFAVIHKIRNKK